jgi:hypothetical protein
MSLATLNPMSQFSSLSAATATGAGASTAVSRPEAGYGLQVGYTGFSAVVVNLEGTVDGVNWFTLAAWTKGTQSDNDIVFVTGKPVVAVRANAATLTGSGTVTATIAVA